MKVLRGPDSEWHDEAKFVQAGYEIGFSWQFDTSSRKLECLKRGRHLASDRLRACIQMAHLGTS